MTSSVGGQSSKDPKEQIIDAEEDIENKIFDFKDLEK